MRRAALALLAVASPPAVGAEGYVCKQVGNGWSWFGSHAVASISYLAIGGPGRRYEIGTGVFFRGAPLGRRQIFAGAAEFDAWGVGAVHIRQADLGEPFKVCLSSRGVKAITILKREF